jgi:hypothetical protein
VSLSEGLKYWREALGWHVEIRNPGGSKIWEGFFNHIELSIGPITIERGPLLDVANRAWMKYQTISYDTVPPLGGDPDKTSTVNDTTSQDKYGILEGFLSGGEATSTQADQAVATYLEENKDARGSIPGLVLSDSGNDNTAVITFNCLGYVHLLSKYYYSNTLATGTINLSAKLQDLLDADPSARFSSDYNGISTNTTPVGDYSSGEDTAWGEIEELLKWGDNNDKRYLFQILNDRKAHYFVIPSEIEYLYSLSDESQNIETAQGVSVARWDVKAAKWLVVTSLLSDLLPTSEIHKDPRAIFIEAADYTLPWHIGLSGGQANTLPQLLKRIGV